MNQLFFSRAVTSWDSKYEGFALLNVEVGHDGA